MGNILNKKEYGLTNNATPEKPAKTISYGYSNDGKSGWNNLLVGVDLDGNGTVTENESITYDEIGNPTTYLGAELSWFGRQLNSYIIEDDTETEDVNEALNVSYTYDADGLRGSKIVNGVKSEYLYLNGQLVYEKKGDIDIYYNYDSYGNYAGFRWYDANGTAYALYALTNSQGDVLGLYNSAGELKIAYTYDTWGKLLSVTDGNGNALTGDWATYAELNPFRYRSYYYDSETGFYYLQSRYYNPEIGRFLDADSQLNQHSGPLGFNMFAYGENNPVIYSDPTGHSIILACLIGGAIIGAITGGAIGASVSKIKTGKVSVKSVVVGALAGAVIGGAVGAAMGAVGQKIATRIASKGLSSLSKNASSKVSAKIKNDVIDLPRTGSALKTDPHHAFTNIVDNYAGHATKTQINNGTLYQLQGSLNGVQGRFEWIIQNQEITHRMFVIGGGINGIPIMP